MRFDDIDPQDIDPDTGRPYPGYSSPSLDTSFHDAEMDVEDEEFIRDDGGFAIRATGFFTVAELEAKLAALRAKNAGGK